MVSLVFRLPGLRSNIKVTFEVYPQVVQLADKLLHTDMRSHFVIDPLISKRQQLLLATQLCRMVLKVNNVIIAGGEDSEY